MDDIAAQIAETKRGAVSVHRNTDRVSCPGVKLKPLAWLASPFNDGVPENQIAALNQAINDPVDRRLGKIGHRRNRRSLYPVISSDDLEDHSLILREGLAESLLRTDRNQG